VRFILREAWNRRGYNIWLTQETGSGYRVAKPVIIEFGDAQDGAFMLPDPTLFLRPEEFTTLRQSLNDELIANGMMKDPVRLVGELEATKKHLEDMRSLTFKSRGL
jgi:hypothetical protein